MVVAVEVIAVADVLVEEVEIGEVLANLDAVEDVQVLQVPHNKLDARHRLHYLKEASYVEQAYLVSLRITTTSMATMMKTTMTTRITNKSTTPPTLIMMVKSNLDS